MALDYDECRIAAVSEDYLDVIEEFVADSYTHLAGKFSMGATAGFPTDENRGNATINRGAMVVPATLEETAKELHMFLYDNAEYEPSSTVKAISKVIESDSGVH